MHSCCRICLQTTDEALQSPCDCRDAVHGTCLAMWRAYSRCEDRCEVCLAKYIGPRTSYRRTALLLLLSSLYMGYELTKATLVCAGAWLALSLPCGYVVSSMGALEQVADLMLLPEEPFLHAGLLCKGTVVACVLCAPAALYSLYYHGFAFSSVHAEAERRFQSQYHRRHAESYFYRRYRPRYSFSAPGQWRRHYGGSSTRSSKKSKKGDGVGILCAFLLLLAFVGLCAILVKVYEQYHTATQTALLRARSMRLKMKPLS